ncbi:hypothetical protein H5410_054075 [Solanum commersonii]|uniref:DUF4283 domain-containing protein n=1 Tax=Solanum commersonii TaxID=4109 RepID=A0A9J5X950_SOLCO|nr:hypothetical protein H5410_054075 [Solanum commersonii]
MTTNSPGHPLLGIGQAATESDPEQRRQYAAVLCPPARIAKPIPMKPIAYLHGEPRIVWEEEEVEHMIIKENLQFKVIGKFSYGWPEIQEIRRLISKHCELRGECKIGLLSNRHVIIRASCLEDYVNLLSKLAFYLLHQRWSYPMRTLKWDSLFDPEKETSRAIAWISFPTLPPKIFVKEVVFLLAIAVGKEEDAFKEQKRKKGGWERKAGQLQVWNPKHLQQGKEEDIMGNKFDALGSLNDEKTDETTQGDGARDNNTGNEIGSTKKWVEEVFNGKERIGESCSNKKVADKERLITEDKRNDIAVLDTSQTIDKDDNEEREKRMRVDLTEDEKQRQRDTEKDGEVNENIDTIARDGDLSPREINN